MFDYQLNFNLTIKIQKVILNESKFEDLINTEMLLFYYYFTMSIWSIYFINLPVNKRLIIQNGTISIIIFPVNI